MNLQQLEYVLATLEHGSFSAAAGALMLSQPSVSEQIRALEAELGVTLFARGARGVVPTAAMEALRPHAEAALAEVALARDAVASQRELRGGIATFGIYGAARIYPGTELVAAFRKRYPGVQVRLIGLNSSEVALEVREGTLEAGMVALPIDDRGLELRPFMRDEIVFVSSDRSRLRRAMTIERLAEAPLILSEASYGVEDSTRRQFAELAQRAGVTIEPEIEVEDVETAIDLVGRGFGDALVARGVLLALGTRVPRRVGWVQFAEPVYDTYAFVNRRGARLSPASRAFMELCEQRMVEVDRKLQRTPRRREPAA